MNDKPVKSRNLNIDLLKTIAMFGVVCLHTTRMFGENAPNIVNLASILYRSAVISIPLFFLVSGYLLCPRHGIDYRYVIKKIYHIIRYVLIFTITYWFFNSIQCGFHLKTLIILIYDSLVGIGPFTVFWYFTAYMGLLLVLPIILKLYQRKKLYISTIIVLLVIQNIVFLHNLTGGGWERLNTCLRWYNWLTYFMIGGFFNLLPKFYKCWGLVIILFVINLVTQFGLYTFVKSSAASFYYSSFVVVVLVSVLTVCILSTEIKRDNRLLNEISKLFLPVFSIHSLFIDSVAIQCWRFGIFSAPICWIIVSILAVTLSWCIMKIPGMLKILKI